MLKPDLRLVNRAETGSLSGFAFDDAGTPGATADDMPLRRAVVAALLRDQEIARTSTDDTGFYMLMGLRPGAYEIAAFARGFRPDTIFAESLTGRDVGRNNLRLSAEP
jgi:hypothetical protein